MRSLEFSTVRSSLDSNTNFTNVVNTGWHADAVYERFSDAEYRRRYAHVYDAMDALELDALIVGGGPSHWSSGGGMLWLTGHFEWHGMACYVLVPRDAEPTLVYSMGGSHIESTRQRTWAANVRPSRMGAFGQVLAEVAREKGLESARTGHPPIDPRFRDYMPVNQYQAIAAALPNAMTCSSTTSSTTCLVEHTEEGVLEPGQVVTLEPNPITADGNLGMFLGHTYVITETGNEMVTRGPIEMIVT